MSILLLIFNIVTLTIYYFKYDSLIKLYGRERDNRYAEDFGRAGTEESKRRVSALWMYFIAISLNIVLYVLISILG